jgi:hypothetical protein
MQFDQPRRRERPRRRRATEQRHELAPPHVLPLSPTNCTIPHPLYERKKPQPLTGRGKLAKRIEVEFGPYRPAASRRAECLLVALPTSWDLLLCAKDLFVEAKAPEPIDHGKANTIRSARRDQPPMPITSISGRDAGTKSQ